MAARVIDIAKDEGLAVRTACELLSEGLPVAIPTETVYGLAADATNPAAVARIYETKGRPRFNPLICHVADLEMAERYGVFDPLTRKLAEAFWPGPLTLVVPLKAGCGIHPLATAGLDTVGLRVPRGFAAAVIRAFDRPLAAPSANTSGRISPTSAKHVAQDLGDKLSLILDGGASLVGVESTILRVEGDRLRLLRPGGVAAEDIEHLTGLRLERQDGPAPAIEAPGMLASHYAPSAAVRLDATDAQPGEALIRFGGRPTAGTETAAAVFDLSPGGDLAEAAMNLFDTLKRADAVGATRIAVAPVPDHGLGEAINDRLARAAAPRDN
ncbi:L-threonylcarbamoyladenylate synthase [Rhizobium sp. 0TCS1.26]|uniref:L-threonylcarbamoyladenylate synthase n=1 Tax=Rhizobium sp. 0TCS1.26 TaxID=3142623 RepID=UPI003D2D4A0F